MHSADDTLSLYLADETATLFFGEQLARAVCGGLTLFLLGDLGAGKTTLARGLLRGLGFPGRVKSPTYTLVEPYALSNLYLHHFDLYRFADPQEWEDAGFREMFNPDSLCLVEWPEKAAGLLPTPDWQIQLEPQETGRQLVLHADTELGRQCFKRLTGIITIPPAAGC